MAIKLINVRFESDGKVSVRLSHIICILNSFSLRVFIEKYLDHQRSLIFNKRAIHGNLFPLGKELCFFSSKAIRQHIAIKQSFKCLRILLILSVFKQRIIKMTQIKMQSIYLPKRETGVQNECRDEI